LGVVAVDRLGPRGDRPPGGDLEHVRREATVGHTQVERRRVRVAVELKVCDLGDALPSARRRRRRSTSAWSRSP